ncbi:MAG TPA: hypothetical protein VHV77_07320 [Pirellulales bacterium]|nr:hypothetical protein [Pirellulales bacterium]
MICFNHPHLDAVGICKSCGRGLCHTCMTEVGLSCCCRDRCEADVATLNDLVERGRTIYQKNSAAFYRQGISVLAMGLIVTALGAVAVVEYDDPMSYIPLAIGIIFDGWAVSLFVTARQMMQK